MQGLKCKFQLVRTHPFFALMLSVQFGLPLHLSFPPLCPSQRGVIACTLVLSGPLTRRKTLHTNARPNSYGVVQRRLGDLEGRQGVTNVACGPASTLQQWKNLIGRPRVRCINTIVKLSAVLYWKVDDGRAIPAKGSIATLVRTERREKSTLKHTHMNRSVSASRLIPSGVSNAARYLRVV